MKRVPMLMPSAPSASAATRPRPSPKPPEAIRGIVLARMAGAFKTVDRDRIRAHALGRQRVADAGALVHDLDAVLLELGDMLLRLVAGGLDDLDAALDDGLAVFGIGRRLDRGQDGQVHAERLVGHGTAARDLPGQILRRRL